MEHGTFEVILFVLNMIIVPVVTNLSNRNTINFYSFLTISNWLNIALQNAQKENRVVMQNFSK